MNDIPRIKIALGGAPMVGKTTILDCFAKRNQNSRFTIEFDETKRITQLDIELLRLHTCFITVSGAYVDTEVIPRVFTSAMVVVYVVSASAGSEEQQRIFKQYVSDAMHVGAHWDDIPWIFVLNKVDLGNQNPLLSHIPAQFHNNIIHCSATQGIGIEQLWQKILAVMSPAP
jgi:predicted GTPase